MGDEAVTRSTAGTWVRGGWGRAAVVLTAGLGAVIVAVTDPGSTVLRGALVLLLVGCVAVASRHHPRPGRTAGTAAAAAAWPDVARELERSRRHGRPMALGRIPLGATPSGGAADEVTDPADLAGELAPALRATDRVWVQGSDLLVLLAEATSGQAQHAVRRLVALLPAGAETAPPRVASFPEDGLTLTVLCECLEGRRPLRRLGPLAPAASDGSAQAAS